MRYLYIVRTLALDVYMLGVQVKFPPGLSITISSGLLSP